MAESGEPKFGLGGGNRAPSDGDLRRAISELCLAQMECALAVLALSIKDSPERDAEMARAWERAGQAFERAKNVLDTIGPLK